MLLLLLVAFPAGGGPERPDAGPDDRPTPGVAADPGERATLRLVSGSSEAPDAVVARAIVGEQVVAEARGALPLSLEVPRDPALWLLVEAPGRARFARQLRVEGDREVRVTLPEGATVRGSVVDEEDHAVVGALVTLEREGDETSPGWIAEADAEGGFTFDTLLDGSYRLSARAPGHASSARTGVEVDGEELRIRLERVGLVSGRVLDPEGRGAAGAHVVIAGSGLWPARQVSTDDEGRFSLPEVPPGIYEVRAFTDTLVAEPRRGLTVEPGGRTVLTFSLTEGVSLRGIVRDSASREPIEGAEITVAAEALDAAPRAARTGPDGRFALSGLRELVHRVSASAEGYVPIAAMEWEPGESLTLDLVRGAVLSGVVLDEDHQPIEGATIEVLGDDESHQPVALDASRGFRAAVFESQLTPVEPMALEITAGPVPPIPTGPGPTSELALVPLPPAPVEAGFARSHRSGADGSFRIEGVPPGRVQVVARRDGYASSATARIFVAAGATRDDLELVLAPAGQLVGRVIDDRERGVEAVLIEVRSDREPYPRMSFTDDRGRFELDGVVGELTVTALPQGQPAARARAEVVSGRETEVTLRLEGELHTLRGRTVDARRFPLGAVQLTVSSLRSDAPHRRTLWSGEDGTFELAGLPAPPWRLEATEPGYAPARVDVFGADEEVRVQLDRGASVSGSVLDDHTSEPVRASIELRRDDLPPEVSSTRADDEGSFAIGRVRAGHWELFVRSDDHLPYRATIEVEERGRAPADVELPTIRLTPAGRLEGTVVDALGAPIARATVSVEGADAPETRTDADGRFVLRGVPPSEARVVARHPAAGEGTTSARVLAGRETPGLVLRLSERFDPERAEALPGRRRGVAIRVAGSGAGIRVQHVMEGSGAERAGLRRGDVLLEIDGDAPTDARHAGRLLTGSPSVPALIRMRRGEREALLVVEREVWIPEP